jgi:D-alanine transaminase
MRMSQTPRFCAFGKMAMPSGMQSSVAIVHAEPSASRTIADGALRTKNGPFAVNFTVIMEIIANWNGQVMPLSEVRVPALDRGYLFGEGIYEVLRVYGGLMWRADDHFARLASGCAELGIGIDAADVRRRAESTLAEAKLKEALVYMQITRQDAMRHHYYPSEPPVNCLIYAQPFDDPYKKDRETGIACITFPDIRWRRNDIKATSLVANCMAANAAHSHKAFEAILVRDGLLTEASHSSVFAVTDGKLMVPPSSNSVLPGITKRQVLELCAARGIAVIEKQLLLSDLQAVHEMFLTATPEEIIGIVKVDDQIIGDGKPGPVTRQLHAEFRKTLAAHV